MNTIQDKNGSCLIEEKEIRNGWTEYCSEVYNHQSRVDGSVLTTEESSTEDNYHILQEAVEATVRSLKCGKSAEADNFPVELLKHDRYTDHHLR